MAKQWVSLLGHVKTARMPHFGMAPEPGFPPIEFVQSNGGYYGRWDEDGTPFYTSRVFLTGREQTLSQLAGKVVRGVRWTLNVRVAMAPSSTNDRYVFFSPPNTFRFGDASVPRLFSVIVGNPIDLDGNGYNFIIGEQVFFPYVTADSGSRWFGVPQGWTFAQNGVYSPSGTGTGGAIATPIGGGYYAASAVHTTEQVWDYPAGLVRANLPAAEDWYEWPGAVVFFDSYVLDDPRKPAPVSAAFTRYDLLVSEKPTWEVEIGDTIIATGAEHEITGRLFYPDEGDGVRNYKLRFWADNDRIQLRPGGSPQWLSEIEITTDQNGEFSVWYKGVEPGPAQINFGLVTQAGVPEQSRLFSPRFTNKAVALIVYTATDTPPVEDPETGEVCVTFPEIPAVPGVPSRVDYIPTFRWDAGANSASEIDGDCHVHWTMGRVTGAVIGFTTDRDNVADYTRMSHGFIFSTASTGEPEYDIIESGRPLGARRMYEEGAKFEVRRVGSTVFYLHNDTVVHTSTTPSVGLLSVGTALYATGDAVPASTGGVAPPPPPPPDPGELRFTGSVPPSYESDVFFLEEGSYIVTESAPGASCDWAVSDDTMDPLVSGVEGSTESLEVPPGGANLLVLVEPYQGGGPFDILIEPDEGL